LFSSHKLHFFLILPQNLSDALVEAFKDRLKND